MMPPPGESSHWRLWRCQPPTAYGRFDRACWALSLEQFSPFNTSITVMQAED